MSRVGKKIIPVPDKVKVKVENAVFYAEGPLGKEKVVLHPQTQATVKDNQITVSVLGGTDESRRFQGLLRALIANAVNGVAKGFSKDLDINGVGYRAEVKGKVLNLTLGFSHPVEYQIPDGIKITVDKQTHLVVGGSNRELVGRVSAEIRKLKPPEPYKGKGIKYTSEVIVRKVGKAAGAGATAAGGK